MSPELLTLHGYWRHFSTPGGGPRPRPLVPRRDPGIAKDHGSKMLIRAEIFVEELVIELWQQRLLSNASEHI
jgi:hypothetical protein